MNRALRMWRRVTSGIISISITGVLLLGGGPTAAAWDSDTLAVSGRHGLAVPGPSSEGPEGATVVRMVLACDEFHGEVRAYAIEHGYCPAGGDDIDLRTVQTYDCGSSWVYAYHKNFRGKMWTSYGFRSAQGVVVHRNISVGTTSGIGWNDGGWMWDESYDTERFVGNFAIGSYHSVTISGDVSLAWGGTCTIPPITAGSYL